MTDIAREEISISTDDGPFMGYLARPATGSGPGLIVIQEIFGVNGVMRELCDGYAAQGFAALCPDLFWRIEPGVQLTDRTDAEWQQAFGLMKAFDQDQGVKDIQAAISHLRGHEASTGKVGAVGYCLGGLMAYLTAARTDIDASVGYYGVSIDQKLGEAKTITRPLMLHVPTEDQFVSKEAQAKMKEGLGDHPQVTLHVYEGRDHAFARPGGAHYHADDAAAANERTATFLKQHLA